MQSPPEVWVTYAWVDDDEGDFEYLVQQLANCGVRAKYDKVALHRGQRLWEQIAKQIIEGDYAGWAYLLTANSVESEACREELAYALHRALSDRGTDFPLIGLLHDIAIEDVPPALRVRLCISMANPNWCEEVRSAIEHRAPDLPATAATQYVWNVSYTARNGVTVEVRPRFGEALYWRFIVPADAEVVNWGHGPAGGGGISATKTTAVESTGEFNGEQVSWFGSGDRVSPGVSAYVELAALPSFVAFGISMEALGEPGEVETIRLS